MKRTQTQKKNSRGFTLVETLVTVLILLLVTAVVAGGMPAAVNALKKAVDAAHAQTVLSTAVTALRDELTTARDVTVSGTTISYTDGDGRASRITIGTTISYTNGDGQTSTTMEDDRIVLSKWGTPGADTPTASWLLVSDEAGGSVGTNKIYAVYTGVTYHEGVVTITGLSVKKNGTPIAGFDDLDVQIRVAGAVSN